jgi:ubiquinone/menaquinone biosynthesis C-methylase UbiE
MSRFDEKAADWDTPERRERAQTVAQAIRERVPLSRDMRAVDLGAGTGLLGLDLLRDVGSMVLADPSAGMVEVARQKIADGSIAGATAVVYDLPAEPPPGAPFDLAVSLLMLHHVEDTAATLRSVLEMLAPGGRMALVDLDAEDGTFHDADAEGVHHHGFDQAAIVRLAGSVGFEEVGTTIVSAIENEGRSYPLFLLSGRRPAGA